PCPGTTHSLCHGRDADSHRALQAAQALLSFLDVEILLLDDGADVDRKPPLQRRLVDLTSGIFATCARFQHTAVPRGDERSHEPGPAPLEHSDHRLTRA